MRPSIFRVMIKDLIDFLLIVTFTALLTYGVYRLSPIFTPVPLSIYFFEQVAELFFTNPRLVLWALGLACGVSLIYFLFCFMLYQNTLGGLLARLKVVDKKTLKTPGLYRSLLMALGAYCGVLAFLWGPLYAWWLDADHRGWSEKFSRTLWRSQHDVNMRPPV
jgi:hypothetical protein